MKYKKIAKYAARYGDKAASEKFNIKLESVTRYKRKAAEPSTARILVFDIETAPLEAYIWDSQVFNGYISPAQIKSEWFMLSYAAKWLNSPKILSDVVKPSEAVKRDHSRILEGIWTLLDEADIVIAHNGRKFDLPKLNACFLKAGMKPPRPYRVIDTYLEARKHFSFTYNKLDYLGEVLDVGRKKDTDFALWVDCVHGVSAALTRMLKYNEQDVLLLEEVYYKLRGWMKSHPNINLFQGTADTCSHCGSDDIEIAGEYTTSVNVYSTYQCNVCGGFSREAKHMLTSVAR